MTPHEERLVLELHSRWGNRWSRIARKLPGRTDNEIKNYWRTHMRKKAQETRKRGTLMSSASSSTITTMVESPTNPQNMIHGKGSCVTDLTVRGEEVSGEEGDYSMEQIWKEIASSSEEVNSSTEQVLDGGSKEEGCSFPYPPINSPMWEFGSDPLWKMDEEFKMLTPMGKMDEDFKMFTPMGGTADCFIFNYDHRGES